MNPRYVLLCGLCVLCGKTKTSLNLYLPYSLFHECDRFFAAGEGVVINIDEVVCKLIISLGHEVNKHMQIMDAIEYECLFF